MSKNDDLRREAIKSLKVAVWTEDVEMAHLLADEAIVNLLEKLGFDDVIDEYEKVKKWYA